LTVDGLGPEAAPGPEAGLAATTDAGASDLLAADPLAGADIPLDAHLHTDLSPDSDVPVDAYARLAVERGVDELAITDHIDFDPGAPAFGVSFEDRERVVRAAAERWADRVAIRFGIEVTYESGRESEIREHLRRYRYDFVIGSVHVYRGSPYERSRVGGLVAGRSLAEIVGPYFDEVVAAARSGLFDTIGHLDYVKKYLVPHVTPGQLAAAPELVEPALVALVEAGVALEINTSGLRQAPGETYPTAATVERFRALGGERVTVGSDAHALRSFAHRLGIAYAAASQAGYRHVGIRRGDDPVDVAIPERFLGSRTGQSGGPPVR
jgi:histidinol-phosphatase (PHP family)